MKLSVMSYTLARRLPPEKVDVAAMCKLAQELKIDGIDMVTTYGRPAEEIRRIIDEHGLKTVCHTFLAQGLQGATAEARRAGVDEVRRGIERAVVLGADKIMIPTPGNPAVPREQLRRNLIGGLQECAAFAAEAGITMTIENFPGATSPFVVSPDVLEAIRAVPGLKLTFDNGNVLTGGENVPASFTACAEHVVHAHFKDWEIVKEPAGMPGLDGRRYRGALVGEGIVDHRGCLAAMKAARYAGYIDIEYEGDLYPAAEATRRIATYLRGLMQDAK
ncbi:MAG: sugar phosphate isomerase/epimerase [Lentisphaerae bacterium]|nr:sugar phosphate isomerase/epimerase [Lentisphaerota bacterium]